MYLDGGYPATHDKHATWDMCAVAEDLAGNLSVALSAGGVAPLDQHSLAYVGEVLPSNSFVAQVYAHVLARVILLQYIHKNRSAP